MGPFLLFLIAIVLQVSKVDSNDKHVKLHNMMTLDEMKEYLETDTEHDIPEYQAIKLSPLNSREKRSASRSGKLYSLTAFDTDMDLDLTTPSNTIGNHGVLVQRHTAKGAHDEIYYPDGEMYHGHVTGDSNSRVAVQVSKDGKKLSGSIFTNDHVYKIQPMSKRLRDKANLHGDEHHVISRREFRKSFIDNVETSKVLESAELRVKRSGHVTLTGPRIIELMITIDKPTYDFYGNQTLDYVLNVANMVNRLYRDPSMGFDLSVVLTKVFIIQHNEPAMDIQSKQIGSARVYIDKFREWVLGMSDLSPPAAPGHFDHASLLTRRICGIEFCEVDGLAFSGYPCNKKLDFNINKASGLQAAFSITHEMAHNIGLGHDEGDCRKGFIMNRGQGSGPNSFRWSPCSSMKMKEIMSRETCYSDKPATSYPVPRRYPGYIYDADTQCKMAYDSTYTMCSKTKNSCSWLFCYKGTGCVGDVGAPLDGTPCGQRKWCIRGSCVDVGSDLPPAIDGQWGSWSNDYTSCTRPCGRGVRFRKRYCNNPSPQYFGKSCQGPSTRNPEICNPQDCATPTDFRLEQCKKRGHDTFFYTGDVICTLRCKTRRAITVVNNVVDGTPCYLDKDIKDVCIKGQCRKVGCDNVLESGVEFDRCRKCDGNGGDCELVKLPDYTKHYRRWGPKRPDLMFTIPAGATNVKIQELDKSANMMSIKENVSSSAPYLFKFPISIDGKIKTVEAAGTVIKHIMPDLWAPDTILIRGPTTIPLYVMYVYFGFNPNKGFSCQYYIPGKGQPTQFVWKDYCNATCAGGTRIRDSTCHRADDDTNVGIQYCDQAAKPAKYEPCNTQPCAPRWITGNWTQCSKTCSGGQQTRSVTCQQKTSQFITVTVNDAYCIQTSKPETEQACNQQGCPEWITSPWSECSVKCGGGTRTRAVSCKKTSLTQATLSLNDSSCTTEVGYKPPTTEQCNTMDCYVWTHDYSCDGCRAPLKMSYHAIGCFKDNHRANKRPLPSLVGNHRGSIVWTNMNKTVAKCSLDAWNAGYPVFGVQFYGECWSGRLGYETYSADGVSDNCWEGVGRRYANYVYGFDRKVVKTSITCRNIITNSAVSQDHCKQTKPDSGLRLCEHAC